MYALHGLLIVAYGMKTCSKVRVLFFSGPDPLAEPPSVGRTLRRGDLPARHAPTGPDLEEALTAINADALMAATRRFIQGATVDIHGRYGRAWEHPSLRRTPMVLVSPWLQVKRVTFSSATTRSLLPGNSGEPKERKKEGKKS